MEVYANAGKARAGKEVRVYRGMRTRMGARMLCTAWVATRALGCAFRGVCKIFPNRNPIISVGISPSLIFKRAPLIIGNPWVLRIGSSSPLYSGLRDPNQSPWRLHRDLQLM